jgi:hypothetical protein
MRGERLLAGVFVLVLAVSLAACGGTSSSSGTTSSSTATVSGSLDGSTVTLASKESPFKKFLALLHPFGKAYAVGETVDNIVAVSPDKTFITATKSGNDFSLNLTKGKSYTIAFLRGTTIVALYKVDDSTGMDALPVSTDTGNISFGTVSLNGGVAQGTLSSSSLLQNLGLTQDIATAYGIMDEGMTRLSTVDADGNGVIDYNESKSYKFNIVYIFVFGAGASGDYFNSVQGAWPNKDSISFKGYQYHFISNPDTSLDWSSAVLQLPQAVNGVTTKGQSYMQVSDLGREIDFWLGGGESADTPRTPPSGIYTVAVGSTTFTFRNVRSQTIDANFNNLYVPIAKLTLSEGKVTKVEWQWWKRLNNNWVQPSDAEISAVLDTATFEINGVAGTDAERVEGSIGLTSTGSVTPPSQDFTPAAFIISYLDKAGYVYTVGDP